jgi:inorganic phosphate transporter, PiT family
MTLTIVVLVIGFYMAWNIGANDVSNALGTSVGSGALTLRRAVIVAAILEFCGAYFVGSNVSETMERGLINPQFFAHEPMTLVLGMCGALLGTGIWLQLASYLRWPVSTTHAIVGAIVGFGLLIGGASTILWKEIGLIVLSWITSPVISAIFSYTLFTLVQKKILFALDPIAATRRSIPWFCFIIFSTFTLSLVFNGLHNLHLHFTLPFAFALALSIGALAFLISFLIMRKVTRFAKDYIFVEKIFVYLQILSASYVAFAHGANDVANAIGPVSAVLDILKTGTISSTSKVPSWLLALGGLGIVIGLATWGWRVIETIGKKITELTPTRGFCAEFGAATTILVASKCGLPISTTHCLVGAILGVGLARGISSLNLGMVREIVFSWIITIPASAGISVLSYYLLKSIFT